MADKNGDSDEACDENAFLELVGVSKGYGAGEERTEVLADINLTVQRGKFVAIVGRSGSGKTTLISLLAGLIRPDTGAIRLGGRLVEGPGPDRGVVFQSYALLPWLTVFQNVFLAVEQRFSEWSTAQQTAYADRYIRLVNLATARDKLPRELSGGMRQRVSVARALALDPEVLLLDEPLSALDALTRGTLQGEIARIWEQERKTVILITNDVDEGILLADEIIPLTPGPRATLGPSFAIEIDRPRSRKELNHDPQYKRLRREVWDFVAAARSSAATA